MQAIHNIFACLVHENQECVIDLVRNLRYLDPASFILLYNGGNDPGLLDTRFPFERYGTVVYPHPRPMAWGRLHDFALDCMRFALNNFSFDTLTIDTLTIVDSDQLAVGSGYSLYLAQGLDGLSDLGLLGSAPGRQPRTTQVPPARVAYKECNLWRPFLRQFPAGEEQFVYWTFWPSTVFTAPAARELTRLFDQNTQLQDIMRRTNIWATEEVILPTLVALLGFKIAANPCSYDYVKYRVPYTLEHTDAALVRRNIYWMHPVPRRYEHGVRKHIRERFNHYERPFRPPATAVALETSTAPPLLLTWPILTRMKSIEGWLEEDEAHLLIDVAARALTDLPKPHTIVEVGSYCGRATVVLGSVVRAIYPETTVYAIDSHDGRVGALDQGIRVGPSTLETCKRNIASAGLQDVVVLIHQRAIEVTWDQPINLLLIDGLHDYVHVARDFFHFESWVVLGGYVAFHDYADYFPGVKTFVNELLDTGGYQKVHCERSLIVLRKQPITASATNAKRPPSWDHLPVTTRPVSSNSQPFTPTARRTLHARTPLVSCIMPTANRRVFVQQAMQYFLRQDYPHCELVIVDDGILSLTEVLPPHPRIRYIRLATQQPLGRKRNVACQAAQGEIIVHWDDDDWMAPWRLSYQVESLLRETADICGLDKPLLYEPSRHQAWQYIHPQRAKAWVYGATLCYTRALWAKNPFLAINVGEDTQFVWTQRWRKLLPLQDCTFCVSVIHPHNVSPKRPRDARWRPYATADIQQLMGEDWAFYANLVSRCS